ncbi:DUF1513 domain-containing protein [Marinomonas dokdonensis]|uniref:DUF1513 domain-containing protein n=1 Tax=Marinomonas dokdonensis TaxID=328224 RepID=UPI00405591EC
MMNRRDFLTASLAGTGLIQTAPSWAALTGHSASSLYASAFTKDSRHSFGLFDEQGNILWSADLPARAHGPVLHPNEAIVGIVARRPGFYIDFYDIHQQALVKRIEPSPEHHFYGHAIFTRDGQKLITQENHYPTGQGKVFIRAWPSGEVLQSFSSNGIGPHESVLLNEQTLVIANGGLKTHPDHDRDILNLDTMAPNATYVSLEDGAVLQQANFTQDLHQLSIRHLDVNPKGIVALGFQYQGEPWENVPLVGLSNINSSTIEPLALPENVRMRFKQYCGSVRFDKSGEVLAISTPRGGLVAYWHVASKKFLGIDNCTDVCGIAATENNHEFFLTSGSGKQLLCNPVVNTASLVKKHAGYHWDNHLNLIAKQRI